MGLGGKARCSFTEMREGNEREGEMKKKEKEMFSTQSQDLQEDTEKHIL